MVHIIETARLKGRKDKKTAEMMRELGLDELGKAAGGAGGGNQINLQVIIRTLRVYPGTDFIKAMMKNESKKAAKEWIVANLPSYLVLRYPGYTLEEIRSISGGRL